MNPPGNQICWWIELTGVFKKRIVRNSKPQTSPQVRRGGSPMGSTWRWPARQQGVVPPPYWPQWSLRPKGRCGGPSVFGSSPFPQFALCFRHNWAVYLLRHQHLLVVVKEFLPGTEAPKQLTWCRRETFPCWRNWRGSTTPAQRVDSSLSTDCS